PDPSLEATLTQAEIAKDQAYAGYLQLKAAQDKLSSYDGSAPASQARAGSDQAYAGYLAARAQQGRLEGTNLSPERRAAQAAVDQARGALVLAQGNLDTAALISPVDGIVFFNAIGTPAADGQIPKAAVGAAIAPQSAPFTVVDLSAVRFVAEVDEVDIGRIKRGMDVVVNLDAFAAESFESTVTQILSVATLTATGGTVFPVQIDLSGVSADLLIGMKGDASIEIDSVPDAVTIPIEALFDEGGASYVYTVGAGEVLKRTQVQIGTLTETRVQVTSGLSDGDVVALSGPVELEDGMRIRAKR
ncbi:MAG: efflux RND transporter periplasmic adaptor subunit, partial [Actinomycetota bacterium]|nr:efflux RND transporter periplasmic adaptor subunit [Actinomycetota bacterium]